MDLDPRLHFVAITGIVARNRQVSDGTSSEPQSNSEHGRTTKEFLIAKRALREKAFPGRWTVPGGKLVLSEYKDVPKTTPDAWYNIVEWVLRKEIREEVNLEVEKPQYLTDLIFIQPDGYPVLVLSYWCFYKSGEVKLFKDLIEHAWVTAEEAKNYDLIEGIWEEIRDVEALL